MWGRLWGWRFAFPLVWHAGHMEDKHDSQPEGKLVQAATQQKRQLGLAAHKATYIYIKKNIYIYIYIYIKICTMYIYKAPTF